MSLLDDQEGLAPDEFTEADYLRGMEILVHAVQELSLARSLPEIQRIVRTSARKLVGCDGTTFVLRDGDHCYYADEDAIEPLWKGSRFPMSRCISGWVMFNRTAAVIPDIYVDPRIPHEAYRPTFVKSLVMVPIRKLDPVGGIGAYWATERDPSSREVALLQALADSSSIAMENVQVYSELEQRVRDRTAALEKVNAEIHQLSVTDDLTGLSNRRGFHLLAGSAVTNAIRNGHSCLLAFIDVDGLKTVNDQHGHDVGDMFIIDVARVLGEAIRGSDILARVGGDEYCILITGVGAEPESVRNRITDAFGRFNARGHRPYVLAASIGVARSDASGASTLDELMACADAMMYEDKRTRYESRRTSGTLHAD